MILTGYQIICSGRLITLSLVPGKVSPAQDYDGRLDRPEARYFCCHNQFTIVNAIYYVVNLTK